MTDLSDQLNRLPGLSDVLLGNNVFSPDIYSSDIVAFNLILTAILAIGIAYTYKYVHNGISYSQSYVYSIVLVSMTVSLAMMVIGNDITRAFALLGTFTIIRYRTAVKDPKDTAFIFMALVLGLAVGSSNYSIAITGTAVFSIVSIILHLVNFGAVKKLDHVLYVTADIKTSDEEKLADLMKKSFKKQTLLNVSYGKQGKKLMYSYNVTLAKESKQDTIIKELIELKGVDDAEILTAANVIEF